MNNNGSLRNTVASMSIALLVALTPACGEDDSAMKAAGGFGLGAKAGTTTNNNGATKNGMVAMGGANPAATGGGLGTPAAAPAGNGNGNAPAAAPGGNGGGAPAATTDTRMHDAAAAQTLIGSWFVQQGACAMVLVFDAARVAIMEGCELNDGTVGVDVEEGSYTVQGSTLTVTSDTFSCGSKSRNSKTANIKLTGDTLTLSVQGGDTYNLGRGQANLNGTQAVTGCLTPEGFTAQ